MVLFSIPYSELEVQIEFPEYLLNLLQNVTNQFVQMKESNFVSICENYLINFCSTLKLIVLSIPLASRLQMFIYDFTRDFFTLPYLNLSYVLYTIIGISVILECFLFIWTRNGRKSLLLWLIYIAFSFGENIRAVNFLTALKVKLILFLKCIFQSYIFLRSAFCC